MDLFRYLMTKNGHNYLKEDDLFSYKLAKGQGGTYAIFEGTTINANNTRRGKMKVNLLGNTSQTGTPTPDNPEQVHTCSGDNEVNIEGENLLDEKGLLNVTFITGVYKYTKANFKGNRTLYFKAQLKSGKTALSGLYVALANYGSNPNSGTSAFSIRNGAVQNSGISNDFTGIEDLYISFYPTSYTWEEINNTYDLWVSINDTTYSEYQGQQSYLINLPEGIELCKIGTYQDKFIRNSGKNKLDRSACSENKSLTWSAGEEWPETGSLVSDFIKAKSGDSFISNYNYVVFFYKEDKTFIGFLENGSISTSGTGSPVSSFIVPTNENVYYTRLSYRKAYNNNTDMTNVNINIMLNEGSTLLPYEPYGDGDWYKEGKIGKAQVSLEGTVYDIGTLKGATFTPTPIKVQSILNLAYCNKSLIATSTLEKVDGRFYENHVNYMFIGSSTDTITELRAKYDGSDFYYPLATPTYTKIEGTLAEQLNALQNSRSYDGQTNINQNNNDLASNMEAQILVNE